MGGRSAFEEISKINPYINVEKFMGLKYEEFWVDRYRYMLSEWYQLRPRFDPDWIPSWNKAKETLLDLSDYEDSMQLTL
ncbi:hypothetical protein DXG03_009063, partial [Asterophora parasitica]